MRPSSESDESVNKPTKQPQETEQRIEEESKEDRFIPKGLHIPLENYMGYSLTMDNLLVQLVHGELAREASDVIVNFNDEKLSCTNYQSTKLIDAAGEEIKLSCEQWL